jgi:TRAP-type C4-dicarboxylate transport system permease small subunit
MAALAAIATLSFTGTMSRYLLSMPIGWVPDWAGYILAASIFVTAPAVTKHGEHVAMDFLSAALTSAILLRVLTGVAAVLTFLVLAAMTWIVANSLLVAFRSGAGTAAGYPIPRWWLLSLITYGFGSSALHVFRAAVATFFGKENASGVNIEKEAI